MRWGGALATKGGASGARGLGGPGAAPGHNGLSGPQSVSSTQFGLPGSQSPLPHGAPCRAMYSGNRSGDQGYWEDGAGAEGAAPAGTRSPAPLFSPTAYERLALLLGCLALLGVGGNLLVLLLYSKFPRLRTPTHLFLVNLSLGDLLVSLFGVTFTFASCLRNGWVWDAVGCAWDGFSGSLFGESPGTRSPCLATFPGYISSGPPSSPGSFLIASHHPQLSISPRGPPFILNPRLPFSKNPPFHLVFIPNSVSLLPWVYTPFFPASQQPQLLLPLQHFPKSPCRWPPYVPSSVFTSYCSSQQGHLTVDFTEGERNEAL